MTSSQQKPKKDLRTVHPISKIKTRPSDLKQRILARNAAPPTKSSFGKAYLTKKDLARKVPKTAVKDAASNNVTRWS